MEFMAVKVMKTTIQKFTDYNVAEVWKLCKWRFVTTWSVSEKHTSQLPPNGMLPFYRSQKYINFLLYIVMVTGQLLLVVASTDFSDS